VHVLRSYEELGAWGLTSDAPIAVTIGYFDGVHRGHQHLFAAMREALPPGGRLLAVTFSNSPREFHQPEERWRFLTTPVEKLLLLGRSGVDATLMLRYDRGVAGQSAALFLRGLQHFAPLHTLALGYDTRLGSDMVSGEFALTQLARRLGLELAFVPPYLDHEQAVKSSRIRGLVADGAVAEAADLLGHPYFLMGPVVHGKGRGAEDLAIPTANLVLPREKLPPDVGVYAAVAETDGAFYPAATCVMTAQHWQSTPLELGRGAVPLLLSADQHIVETHLIGYSGNLYGSTLILHFLDRLRGWQDFSAVDALAGQIQRDITATVAMVERSGFDGHN
jgi:riboflavin kinase/FMN adenylyltransferase